MSWAPSERDIDVIIVRRFEKYKDGVFFCLLYLGRRMEILDPFECGLAVGYNGCVEVFSVIADIAEGMFDCFDFSLVGRAPFTGWQRDGLDYFWTFWMPGGDYYSLAPIPCPSLC